MHRAFLQRTPASPVQSNDTKDPSPAEPSFALANNSWVRRARIPTARIAHAAGLLNNAAGEPVLYIFGGNDPIEEFPVRTIEAYNYVTNRWTTKASTLHAFHMNGVGMIGGKLYVSGGLVRTGDGAVSLATLYAYDPVRDILTRKADMPRVGSEGVAGVIGSKLYVLTGTEADEGDVFSRRFYRYDPATNKWTTLPSCPRFHRLGAGAVSKDKFYVVGGMGTNVRTRHVRSCNQQVEGAGCSTSHPGRGGRGRHRREALRDGSGEERLRLRPGDQ